MIAFEKYVGAGNDFILVERANAPADLSAFARAVCDRHFGVGADGLLAASYKGSLPAMEYYNADGSAAAFCGNGLRCFAVWAAERGCGYGQWFSVLTACGARRVKAQKEKALVEMGRPEFLPCPPRSLPSCEKMFLIGMNVPHLVLFYDGAVPDAAALGPQLACDAAFGAEGVNVNLVSVTKNGLQVRTFERGSGLTPACGTGCCAAAAAAGILPGQRLQIETDGGILQVRADNAGRLWLAGPACRVCGGKFG